MRRTSAWLIFLAAAAAMCAAQEPFPGEPPPQQQKQNEPAPPPPQYASPAPLSSLPFPDEGTPTIHVNTSVVLVPTLVEKPSGDVIYTLKAKDFTLLDNGVKQDIRVDAGDDSQQPLSLVICMQRGRDAALEFDKFARLGPLLDLFLGQGHGEAALVVFDSKPLFLADFSKDTSEIANDLQQLPPGDGGAAILDAVGYSVDLLEHQPPDHRRVLLLLSETRDHGSRHVNIPQLVKRIGTSNTLVLSLAFSPSKAEFIDWGKGNTDGGTELNLLAPLVMTINAMRKNTPKTLASMSGGEYASFTKDKGFENRIAEVANHSRNRYVLSFRPTDPTPGLHTIRVTLNQDYGARVVARASYWAVNDQQPNPSP